MRFILPEDDTTYDSGINMGGKGDLDISIRGRSRPG